MFAAANVAADDPITLPTVTVVAKGGGGNIVCTGAACMDFIAQLQQEEAELWPSESDDPVPPMEELPVDKAEFCQRLKDSKPTLFCGLGSPPSVPGYDPSWQPNGCGVPGPVNWMLDKVMSSPLVSNYSQDLDAPSGVSFLSACNRHDQCWGEGMDRTFCDDRFREETLEACDAVTDPGAYGICSGFASLYHGAVSPTNVPANLTYDHAKDDHACAAWSHDMQANSCPQ